MMGEADGWRRVGLMGKRRGGEEVEKIRVCVGQMVGGAEERIEIEFECRGRDT